MTFNTADHEPPANNRITITIDDLDLPDDETERDALREKLQQAVHRTLIEETTIESTSTSITEGYEYASLPAECPDCGELPDISGLTLYGGELDVAKAKFECRSCGFSGGATFRLVDLDTNKYNFERGAEEDAEASEDDAVSRSSSGPSLVSAGSTAT